MDNPHHKKPGACQAWVALFLSAGIVAPAPACAAIAADTPVLFGTPVDFILFALTLLAVALFHRHMLRVALAELAVFTAYKLMFTGFKTGVALSNMYPEARNAGRWLYHGWHFALACVIGFCVLLAVLGWEPTAKRGDPPSVTPMQTGRMPQVLFQLPA